MIPTTTPDLREEVEVEGVSFGTTTLRASIAGQEEEITVEVMVLMDNSSPGLVAIEPGSTSLPTEGQKVFTVTLEHPAPVTGLSLDVVVSGGIGNAPATVAVAPDGLSSSFTFLASSDTGSGEVTVSAGDSEVVAQVMVLSQSSFSMDVGGYKLIQTSSSQEFTIPVGTPALKAGESLIVARNATQAEFEAEYGPLPVTAIYLNSKDTGSEFPVINGGETFELRHANGDTVDGPSAVLPKFGCFTRSVPVGPAGDLSSWTDVPANPGSVALTNAGLYISEFCDAQGEGKFVFEFVEIHFDGAQ